MSTLSGIAAKGEKGKQKFQSLDINNLYRASRGESLETHQHKSTSSRRHGMQTLGKVPSARRAPANLPSLKSEYSGNDPAVSLVPSGGTGWGSKPGETGPPPATHVSTSTTPVPPSTTTTSTPPVTVAATVSTPTYTAPTPPTTVAAPSINHTDKSWSSITSSGTEASPMFLAHQSPYFQQEFPSLSGDANATSGSGPNKSDTTHLPGPSLRPQTEGSWMQGGSRPQGQMAAGVGNQQGTVPVPGPLPLPHLPQGLDVGGGRNNLAPSGVAVGPAGPIPPTAVSSHYRLMPQFMIRQNPSAGFPPNYQHGPPRLRFPYPPDTRFMQQPNRTSTTNIEQDDVSTRPIIKEEDLKVMDEAGDTGWAVHDEIDYNQTLSFSDEEGAQDEDSLSKNFRHSLQIIDKKEVDSKFVEKDSNSLDSEEKLTQENSREVTLPPQSDSREPPRSWTQQSRPADFRQGGPPPMVNFPPQPNRLPNHQNARQGEDEEVWRERRRLQHEEIAIAVERAKQRKEEEEKRYEETRQKAARKLQILEEKMRSKTGVDKEESSESPPPNTQSSVLAPEWEKDKEKNRSRTNSENKDEKSPKEQQLDGFKNAPQVDNRSFGRDRERERERELRSEREGAGQPFSRQFQSNLPPRFQKQAAERPLPYYRQSSGGSPQPPSSGQAHYDARWSAGAHFGGSAGNSKSHRNRNDSDLSERDRDENKDINRDREGGFDNRERFNRTSSRDNWERNHESNWKGPGLRTKEEAVPSRISSDSEHSHQFDKTEKCQDTEDNKDKDQEFKFYDRENDKKSKEHYQHHSIQEIPFDEKENTRESKMEMRDVPQKHELRDRPERPQRPDSHDSWASRDSRNSKDSIREDNKLLEEGNPNESSLSWAESTYEMEYKEDKRRRDVRDDCNMRRDSHVSYPQRHIPGPITKEKLEASELKCDSSRNLVPLNRTDKKPEVKKNENQWEVGGNNVGDAWQQISPSPAPTGTGANLETWVDLTGPSVTTSQPTQQSSGICQEDLTESQQPKVECAETNKTGPKILHQEHGEIDTSHRPEPQREKPIGRGVNRGMRHDPRGQRAAWGNSYYRGGPAPWRGDTRGRRVSNQRPNLGLKEWGHSESEASADEVSASTESGKEDKRLEHDRKPLPRSPKQGMRKYDKDERLKEGNRKVESDKDNYLIGSNNRRYDKRGMYDNNRIGSGFEPRGEPSRRGRGAPFRSKGSAANVGRRMVDGYGPPTSKRPFTSESISNVHEDKKTEHASQNQTVNKEDMVGKMSYDDKIKINQQQLAAGIIGVSRPGNFKSQPPNMPPRLRGKSEGERRDRKSRDQGRREPQDSKKSGSGSGGEVGDENWETTSETSEQEEKEQRDNERQNYNHNAMGPSRGQPRRQSNRSAGREKRSGASFDREDHNARRSMGNSAQQFIVNGSLRNNKQLGPTKEELESKTAEQSVDKRQLRPDREKRNNLDRIDLCNTASVVVVDDQPEVTVEEDQRVFATDNNGFQEVRSKKNVKEANRQQKEEPQKGSKERAKPNKPPSSQSPGPAAGSHPTTAPNKGPYDQRSRGGKLPPRFVKLKETNRLQKMAQQQQTHDVNELNKINMGGVAGFPIKDLTSPAPPPPVNAWDKPITAALRTSTPPSAPSTVVPVTVLEDTCNVEVNEHVHSTNSSQRSSPSGDKAVSKLPREPTEKTMLDGSSAPVQTIIFENTNYKSAPVDVAIKSKYTNHINKNQRPEKNRDRKLEEENVAMGYKSPGPEMKLQDPKTESLQMPISFNKNEDNADMKLDFRFDSDLSQLTDDKSSKHITSIQMNRSIQMTTQSSAAELQIKLASVKKVWENSTTVLEHSGEENNTVSTATSFTPTFGNSVEDSGTYGKTGVVVQVVDSSVGDDNSSLTPDSVYNSGQQMQSNSNSYNGNTVQNMIKPDPSSNVKPQPQATMHPHGPLSPPSGAFNSSSAQPSQHINYQIRESKFEPKAWIQIRDSDSQKTGFNQSIVYTYLSNCEDSWHKVQPPGADPQQFQQCRPNITPPAQYGGISAIPSPPTAFNPQAELYPTFQINNPQVMGSQGRSQFSQFASPYMSQGLGQTSGFSQQSMYLHQAAPPPSAAPPDLFQTQLSQYRMQPPTYGTSQQLSNNPNTVLISSSTNSLVSESVKPSPQPIGTIGTKGASYQTPSQPPPSQLYIYSGPQLLNQSQFLQNSQLVQRPASNVVSAIPPSSGSYYSASTGGGAGGFYQPGSSNLQAAAQSMHQATYGIQAFNTQSPAATPPGMGSFGSTFLSNGLQMAQQYRSTAPSYLKSAADHQDVLSVFSSPVTQINSPKSRTNCGKPSASNGTSQQQPSPTQSHKFTAYQQNVSPTTQLMIQQQQQQQQRASLGVRVAPRYPAPIQRPVTFQPVTTRYQHRLPTRYKMPPPPAAVATTTHYYVSQNNTTKLDNTDLESKDEVVSSECEISSTAVPANKSTDIASNDSTLTNN